MFIFGGMTFWCVKALDASWLSYTSMWETLSAQRNYVGTIEEGVFGSLTASCSNSTIIGGVGEHLPETQSWEVICFFLVAVPSALSLQPGVLEESMGLMSYMKKQNWLFWFWPVGKIYST